MQWVVKKIKWARLVSLVSIRGRWVSVSQNSLRLGRRGSASTQLLQTIQTHRKTDRQRNTHRQNEQTIICTAEGVSFPEVFSRKIASPFPKS